MANNNFNKPVFYYEEAMTSPEIVSRLYANTEGGLKFVTFGIVNTPSFNIRHQWSNNSNLIAAAVKAVQDTIKNATTEFVDTVNATKNALPSTGQSTQIDRPMYARSKTISYDGFVKVFDGTDINIDASLNIELVKSSSKPEDGVKTRLHDLLNSLCGNFAPGNMVDNNSIASVADLSGNTSQTNTQGQLYPPNNFTPITNINLGVQGTGTYQLNTPFGIYYNLIPNNINVEFSPTVAIGTDDPIYCHVRVDFEFARAMFKEDILHFLNTSKTNSINTV